MFKLMRAVEQSDWDVPSTYAARIQILDTGVHKGLIMSRDDANALCGALQHRVILPRLTYLSTMFHLEDAVQSLSMMPLYLRLFGPTVQALNMTLFSESLNGAMFVVPEQPMLLKSAARNCSNLKHMACHRAHISPSDTTASDVVCGFRHLQTLMLNYLDYTVLHHIARLDTLKRLRINFGSDPAEWQQLLELHHIEHEGPTFRSLEKLFCSGTIVTLSKILTFLRSCPLSRIDLELEEDIPIGPFNDLVTLSQNACQPNKLRSLSIQETPSLYSDPPPPRLPFTTQSIKVLCAYRNLTHCVLVSYGLIVDAQLLDTLARAWPNIQNLTIGPRSVFPQQRPMVGIQDLAPFAKRCPRLRYLTLCVDGTSVGTPIARSTQNISQLLTLNVWDSPAGNPHAVASALIAMFPCLENIQYLDRVSDSWMEVSDTLGLSVLDK